jgi:hypothetical protein
VYKIQYNEGRLLLDNMRPNMDANLDTGCIDRAKEVLYYHILYKVNWTRGFIALYRLDKSSQWMSDQ